MAGASSRGPVASALTADEVLDFADRHAGVMVVGQGQLNPYKLGIELFRHIEDRLHRAGRRLEDATLDEMEALWAEAKDRERGPAQT